MLRISGVHLDIDALVIRKGLHPESVWRKGERRSTSTAAERNRDSGMNYCVSDAGFEEFEIQKSEAIEFLKRFGTEITDIVRTPGVEMAILDFGISRRDAIVQSDSFPPELVGLAGGLGLSLELSQYPLLDRSGRPGNE